MDKDPYAGIPAELHATLDKALERLAPHEGWAEKIARDSLVAGNTNNGIFLQGI